MKERKPLPAPRHFAFKEKTPQIVTLILLLLLALISMSCNLPSLLNMPSQKATPDASLGLLGRRSGLSLDQVRTRGMALLAAGDLARCQQKAAAVINELRNLQNKDTDSAQVLEDIKPEELCKEVKAADLFQEVALSTVQAPTPKATSTVSEVDSRVKFLESDCLTEGDFSVTPYPDQGSLTCDYISHYP